MAKKIDLDGLEHFKAKENASIAGTESSSTASKAYKVGEYFYFKGTLVVCIVDIPSGGTITLNTNCKTVPLADAVSDLKTATSGAFDGDGSEFYVTQLLDVTSNGVRRANVNGKLRLSGTASSTRYGCYFSGASVNAASSTTLPTIVKKGVYKVELSITGKVTNVAIRYTYDTVSNAVAIKNGDTLILAQDACVIVVIQNSTNYGVLANGESTLIDLKLKKITPIYDKIQTLLDEDEQIKVYTDFLDGYYYDLSGTTVDITSPVSSSNKECIVVDCKPFDRFIVEAWCDGDSSLTYCFLSGTNTAYTKATERSNSREYTLKAYAELFELIAPFNAEKLVVNHHGKAMLGYNPKVYKLSRNDIVNKLAYESGILPYKAKYVWMNKVISVYKNMIAINDGGVLKLSKDNGNTWNNGVDVSAVGTVIKAHLFNNGCLGFFTDTKAYYIESEWTSYNEASCYEADGSAFVPQASGNFSFLYDHKEREYLDTQDMYVFNTYNEDNTFRKLVWYSIDNGHSYKIAYEFGLEDTFAARHIHDVCYYQPEDKFIVSTGDNNATECRVSALTYDSANDTWSIESLADPSRDYKWGNITTYAQEIYYTYDNTPGKIMKCKYEDIADVSKHIILLDNMECDAVAVIVSNKGEIVATQSTYRSTGSQDIPIGMTRFQAARFLYYSSDGKNFNKVTLPLNYINGFAVPNKTLPVATDNKCFLMAGVNMVTIELGDFLRTQGFNNAFKPF